MATLEHTSAPEPQLIVTYTLAGGATAPSNTSPPVVSGVAQQGQTLTASTGTWSGTAPISYAYRWQRCSPGCLDIAGCHLRAPTWSRPPTSAPRCARSSPPATRAGSSEANSAQTAAVVASGQNTVTFSVAPAATTATSGRRQPARRLPTVRRCGTRTPATTSSPPADDSRSASSKSWTRSCASTPPRSPTTPRSPRPSCALHLLNKADADDRDLVGEWYAAANWPIDGADWTLNPGNDRACRRRHHQPHHQHHRRARLDALGNVSLTGYTASGSASTAANPAATTTSNWPPSNTTAPPNHNSSSPTPPPAAPPAVEYVAAAGVGGGAAGADADGFDGIVVGDGADLLRLPLAALQPGLPRHRRRHLEQLPRRGRRHRRHPARCRHRQQLRRLQRGVLGADRHGDRRRSDHRHLQRRRGRRRRRRPGHRQPAFRLSADRDTTANSTTASSRPAAGSHSASTASSTRSCVSTPPRCRTTRPSLRPSSGSRRGQSRRGRPQPHRRVVRRRQLADRPRRLGPRPRHDRARRSRHDRHCGQQRRRAHTRRPGNISLTSFTASDSGSAAVFPPATTTSSSQPSSTPAVPSPN